METEKVGAKFIEMLSEAAMEVIDDIGDNEDFQETVKDSIPLEELVKNAINHNPETQKIITKAIEKQIDNAVEELDMEEYEETIIDVTKGMVSKCLGDEKIRVKLAAKVTRMIDEAFENEAFKEGTFNRMSEIVASQLAERIIKDEAFVVEISFK
ncbi:MAG: hypothetical protein U9M90_04035 [Patescibacteria group bacterium]|nr:hypothetical protein [Patescibacteria group bacterium]